MEKEGNLDYLGFMFFNTMYSVLQFNPLLGYIGHLDFGVD